MRDNGNKILVPVPQIYIQIHLITLTHIENKERATSMLKRDTEGIVFPYGNST